MEDKLIKQLISGEMVAVKRFDGTVVYMTKEEYEKENQVGKDNTKRSKSYSGSVSHN